MKPEVVGSGTPEVYSKRSPGASTGGAPTTPSPRTSCLRPEASVMIQCRVRSCTVSCPELVITMVYDQKYCDFSGAERPGMKFGSTVTSIWRVMARYMRADLRESTRINSRKKSDVIISKNSAPPTPAAAPPASMVKMNNHHRGLNKVPV